MVLGSYETQTKLYQDYVNQDGRKQQIATQLAQVIVNTKQVLHLDPIGTDGDLVTEEKAAQWLLDHAADYGFVVPLSQRQGKRDHYMAEEWHLRYVGKEAKEIAASGLSLEEYYGFEGGDYVD